MKKTIKALELIAIVAVIGFSITACGKIDSGNGTVPAITTESLPDGTVGIAYSQELAASEDASVTWSLKSGALPPGLNLFDNGEISGTPTMSKPYTFTVKATNAAGSDTKDLTITITTTGGDTGNTIIDTAALSAAIREAQDARYEVKTASAATEVPEGKLWVTESEWETFDNVYKTAVKIEAEPSSQLEAYIAEAGLQTALVAFNAAKKEGTGTFIKLSGTITVKNNGQIIPLVILQAHADVWEDWNEQPKIHLTQDNQEWEIITSPLASPIDIVYTLMCYSAVEDGYFLFSTIVTDAEGKPLTTTIHDQNIENINLSVDANFITLSGTLNIDYGEPIPSVTIQVFPKDDPTHNIGATDLYNVDNTASWSVMIPPQASDTDITFNIVGFDGPMTWDYNQLFALWNYDCDSVTIKDQDKSGIKLNCVKLSGTVNVADGNGKTIPTVNISVNKPDYSFMGAWIGGNGGELKNPPANAPWSIVIPAFAGDTEININVNGEDGNGETLFWSEAQKTVKDTNVSDIAFNYINISGTISVTYEDKKVPEVWIFIYKKAGEDDWEYLDQLQLYSPYYDAPWSFCYIPAFTEDTEIKFSVQGEYGYNLFNWGESETPIITVKDANVSGIALDLGEMFEE